MSNFIPLPPTYAVTDPQVRAVLDVLSRNMQVVIDAGTSSSTNTTLSPIGGPSSFGSPGGSTNITNLAPAYTLDTLTADLKRGAAEVVSGALNGTTVMKLEPAGQYVVFQHKDAVILGTTGTYAGTVRTGLGITSTGILGGYNRTSDGAWQTTFAIESSTGNLTLLGTIRAASIISVDAYLGSTLVSDVVNNSAAVTTKLNKSAADILSGTIEFQSAGGFKTGTIVVDGSGNATGAGVAITNKGIVGRNVGATTFTIDAVSGAATFGGALVAASGSFVGTVSAGAIITDSVTLNSAGGTSLSIIASQASGALPSASFGTTLQSSLNSGVTNILAGTGSNYRLKVDASLAFIAFQHKDAVYNSTSAAGLGILPAVGISAAGIAMGYNDNSGAWNNAVALSAVGDLTVKGTITAGSIIVGSVTIGAGGTTLTTIESNAYNGNLNANTALTTKLNKNASDILSGDITFSSAGGFKTGTIAIDGSGNVTGAGVAFTSQGIVGRNAGATTFTINASTGAATFKGDITGASGIFSGDIITSGRLEMSGTGYTYSGAVPGGNALAYMNASLALYGLYVNHATGGLTSAALFGKVGGTTGVGVQGESTSTNVGAAVRGLATAAGSFNTSAVQGIASGGGAGVAGQNTGSGVGLYCDNKFQWGAYTATAFDGNASNFLNGQGNWVAASSGGVSSLSTSNSSSGLTLSASASTGAVTLTLSGTPTNATNATNATYSDYLGGVIASSWARIFATNSGNANAGGSGVNLLGSTSTGIAGAYVGTSGTSNIVTFTVQTTSPSDIRLKEEIANIDLGLAFVNRLRPVSYKLKADPKHQKGYGFIADEVDQLIPTGSSLVYFEPDWKVGEDTGFKTIHYPSYVAVLTKAIQELSAKVAVLESANA